MKQKVIVLVVIILLLGSVFIVQNSKSETSAQQIKTVMVARKTFTKSVQSSGKTKAKKSASVQFQTSGFLSWVGVSEGDQVAAYQTLAKLDSREVEKKLKDSLLDYSKQRNDFEEVRQVDYLGAAPYQALNDTAKRILEKNQWDLEKAVNDVEISSLAVEFARLTTPIAGIITHIDAPIAGVNITPATSTIEIVDPTSLIFEANIDEVDVGQLSVGQQANIALDAFPGATFSGKISYISYSSILSGGGATVFPVQITFDEPQKLRIGLNGDVTIETTTLSDVLIIPIEAIREQDSGKFVYKKSGTSYTLAQVGTGEQNDTDIVITDGLSAGDKVVIKGFASIPKIK